MKLLGRILWLLHWIVFQLGFVWYLVTIFAFEWLYSRDFRRFLWGLPAVLVVVILGLAMLPNAWPQHRERLYARYRIQVEQALDEREAARAELYVCRLIEWGVADDDPWLAYARGRVVAAQGDLARAWQLMSRLAPVDETGYGPAHFWLAKNMLRLDPSGQTSAWGTVRHHLTQAVQADPENLEGHALLGQLYFAARRLPSATEHLERAVEEYPNLRLMLARAYLGRGQKEKVTTTAQAARDHFAAAVKSEGRFEDRLLWADAEILLGHFERAIEILNQAPSDQKDGRHREAMAQIYLSWSDAIRDRDGSPEEQLEKLREVLDLVPGHTAALDRVAAISSSDEPSADQARRWLAESTSVSSVPPSTRLVLGTKAASRGDLNVALEHLEQAYQQGMTTPELLNNLGWTLAHVDPPQYERAVEMLTRALEQAPRNAEMRETRGQIYLQMGRYQDAITDLELALRGMSQRAAVHASLATAYENLGDPAMAATHRKLSEQQAVGSQSDSDE